MSMDPEDVLAKAADLVEFSGQWVNREPIGDREVCALTALSKAAGVHVADDRHPAYTALRREINDGVASWNDAPGRTKEEVATALRNAKRWL